GHWLTRVMQYSADHPACAELGEKVLATVRDAHAREILSFGVLRDGIVLEEVTPGSEPPLLKSRLAPHLHARGLLVVRFLPSVSLEELRQFIDIMTLPPATVFDRGGVGRLLLDRNVVRVQVEEIAHDITEEERESQRRRKELRAFFATTLKKLLA